MDHAIRLRPPSPVARLASTGLALAGCALSGLGAQSFSTPYRFSDNHWSVEPPVTYWYHQTNQNGMFFDRKGTLHMLYGADWRYAYISRQANGTWSNETWTSSLSSRQTRKRTHLDSSGHLHLFFEQHDTNGALRCWYTSLDTTRTGSGWSTPLAFGSATTFLDIGSLFVDSRETLHLIIRARGGLRHWYKSMGGTLRPSGASIGLALGPWGPVAAGEFHRPMVEDSDGNLHLCTGSSTATVLYSKSHVTTPGTWTHRTPFTGTAGDELLACYRDSRDRLHVIASAWRAGRPAIILHTMRDRTGQWSPQTGVSIGAIRTRAFAQHSVAGPRLQEDGQGDLHLIFLQKADTTLSERLYHTRIASGNPSAGWSKPAVVTPQTRPGRFQAMHVDPVGRVHVFYHFDGETYVRMRRTSGTWTQERPLSDRPGAKHHRIFSGLDGSGRLHLLFTYTSGGPAHVFHRVLNSGDPGAGWSAPVDVVGGSAAQPFRVHIDPGHNLHLFFANGAEYRYVAMVGGRWTVPIRVATARPSGILRWGGFAYDQEGDVHMTFSEDVPSKSESKAWHMVLTNLETLRTDTGSISVVRGGTQRLSLRAGLVNADRPYLLLGSISGTAPGFVHDGFQIPLVPDAYFAFTHSHPNQAPLSGSLGRLSTTGTGTAAVTLPPGLTSLLGLTVHHAFVVADNGKLTLISNPVALRLER